MSFDYLNGIDQYNDQMIQTRRYLHQHPEVSFKEYETSAYITKELKSLKHVEILHPTETSVIAKFLGKQAGAKIGLRADTDALPIHEQRDDLNFASVNEGVMHACGHDAHTAMLLTACQWFDEHYDMIKGEINCIFQHAEELPPGGAQAIADTGVLNDLDFVYGQHVSSNIDVGHIDIKPSAVTTNTDEYHLTIHGKGGHSSMPHHTINPMNIATKILQAFEAIPAQHIGPQEIATVVNTYIKAGHPVSLNITPDSTEIGGSVRTYKDKVADRIQQVMEDIVAGICKAYGATYEFNFVKGCQSVINDEKKTAFIDTIAEQLYPEGVLHLPPSMGGEDFAVYSRIIPSTFVWIGARNESKGMNYPHHHPKFAIDEASLMMGLTMLISVALEYSNDL